MEITFLPYTKNLGKNPEMILTECTVRRPDSPDHGMEVTALWDTGSNLSMISKDLARTLHLEPFRHLNSHTTNGIVRSRIYNISIMLPNGAGLPRLPVVEGDFEGHDIIIGMDLITLHDFSLTHSKSGDLIFSIVFPPLNTPVDYTPLSK